MGKYERTSVLKFTPMTYCTHTLSDARALAQCFRLEAPRICRYRAKDKAPEDFTGSFFLLLFCYCRLAWLLILAMLHIISKRELL